MAATPERAPKPSALDFAPLAVDRPILFDPFVILIVGALMTIGIAMVYSAQVSVHDSAFDLRQWWRTPLRQGAFAVLGFISMLIVANVDYRILNNNTRTGLQLTRLLWLVAFGLLVAVFIPGVGSTQMGATRWIRIPLGGLDAGFQPAEFAKVALVVWLAARLAALGLQIRDWTNVFVYVVLGAGMLIALTGIEDYGTAGVMGVLLLLLLFAGSASLWQILSLILLGAAGAGLLLFMKPHRLQRIYTFMSENPDPQGDGYQIYQALLALGSGGWWGRGLGAGVQKYGYLPQDHNDFILAIICEELGVAGGIVVVSLFFLLLLRATWIVRWAPDSFGKLLASGLAWMICLQAALNVAVVTNSVPTKGISLPFVSAGGSGMLFLGIAAGLLASVGGAALRARAGV